MYQSVCDQVEMVDQFSQQTQSIPQILDNKVEQSLQTLLCLLRKQASLWQQELEISHLRNLRSPIAVIMANLLQYKLTIPQKQQIVNRLFSFFLNISSILIRPAKLLSPECEQRIMMPHNNVRNFLSLAFYLIGEIHDFYQCNPRQLITNFIQIQTTTAYTTTYKSLFANQLIRNKVDCFQTYTQFNIPSHQSTIYRMLERVVLGGETASWADVAINLHIFRKFDVDKDYVIESISVSSILWKSLPTRQKKLIKKLLFQSQREENIFERAILSRETIISSNLFTYTLLELDLQIALGHVNIFGYARLKEEQIDIRHKQQIRKIIKFFDKVQELRPYIKHFQPFNEESLLMI